MAAVLRLASIAFAVTAALLLAPAAARACSCALPPPPDVALANSDAVFEGVAGDSRRIMAPSGVRMLIVRLEVERRWKGDVAAIQEVVTPEGDGPCGFPFASGTRYLVYARRQPDLDVFFVDQRSLYVTLCWRTRLSTDGAEDLGVLGPGMPPQPAPPVPDAGPAAPDGASSPDAPARPDPPDASPAPDAARPAPRSPSGCAYAASGSPGAAGLALLVLLLAARPRRRR